MGENLELETGLWVLVVEERREENEELDTNATGMKFLMDLAIQLHVCLMGSKLSLFLGKSQH